jgi:predicted site-specific integrase-resolvase
MTNILPKDEYLTERALAELWNVKRNTLQKWRSMGVGPQYIKRVGRIVYRKADIVAFEHNNIFQGTNKKA